VVDVDNEISIDCRATEIEVEARRAPSKAPADASFVASILPSASTIGVVVAAECVKMVCHEILFFPFIITFSSAL
jgi:hypothetical protein